MIPAVQFCALLFTALALIPSGAHVAALPNKIGMTETAYFTVQGIYYGWAILGLLWPAAIVASLLLAFLVRTQSAPFWCAIGTATCFAVMLAVFVIWTLPANQATVNWTTVPDSWQVLRLQWEYSHAANAALALLGFCLATLSVLWWRQSIH